MLPLLPPSFPLTRLSGEKETWDKYQGYALLIVNTASSCGFTPQYAGLEKLFQKYHSSGFFVLGFPSHQFFQESGQAKDIQAVCDRHGGVSFPLFEKTILQGKNAHPLFVNLRSALPGRGGLPFIFWNFTKFLIDKKGKPIRRFSPSTSPESLEKDIEKVLES